ncbi:MAG: 4'-phosphopantetheinyl transferase superfamily protein [Burkholderiales bacterium]|nr:4'-phosphopantetheinyl transferase superfamily protein [Burkholderiales bacterium]
MSGLYPVARLPVQLCLGSVAALSAAAQAHGLDWLSADERLRLGALTAPPRRAQFIAGRWLLRQLLVQVYGGKPEHWPLSAPAHGAPRLQPAARQPGVSIAISHSADHVACAVSGEPVGLDIESTLRERDFPALVAAVGTDSERRHMHSLEPARRAAFFYGLWSLKEAWLKSRGEPMTPGRMAQLETAAVNQDVANAWLWRMPEFVIAVVAPPAAQPQWADGPLQAQPFDRCFVIDAGAATPA